MELGHDLDVAGWPARNAAGEVPNVLPFGLDSLQREGHSLAFRPQLTNRRLHRLAQRANRLAAGLEWVETATLSHRQLRRTADVVLGWDEWTGIPAALRVSVPRRSRLEPPVVSGIMNLTDWPHLRPHERRLLHAGMVRCAGLFQHSRAQADILVRDWGIPVGLITVVPFGVDPDFFAPTGDPVEEGLVVSVGDDSHRDYPGLFAAFRLALARAPGARLFAATTQQHLTPPDDPTIEVFRDKLGSARPRRYSSAQVVAVKCHPQVHGSGLSVIVEAMACGRPWVATDSLGLHDHLSDGDGGILVPPGDTEAFADALVTLLNSPTEASRLGRIGRGLVERRLNTNHQNAAIAALLSSVSS